MTFLLRYRGLLLAPLLVLPGAQKVGEIKIKVCILACCLDKYLIEVIILKKKSEKMKRFLLLLLSISIITMYFIDCQKNNGTENGDTLYKPNVSYEVCNDSTLRLFWNAITNAEGYYIYADGNLIYSTTDNTFDLIIPAAMVEVSAFAGSYEGEKTLVDCSPVVASNITVWGNSDPDTSHPSGFGFAGNGTAIAYAISNPANEYYIDYYFNDHDYTPINILRWPNINEYNTSANSGLSNFDNLKIAEAPSGSYSTHSPLIEYMVYSLWIDPNANGWDSTYDHFGKMRVKSIIGSNAPYTVTIKCAYQLIPGLRWVVTQ